MDKTRESLIMRKEVDYRLIMLRETVTFLINYTEYPKDIAESMNTLHDIVEQYFLDTNDLQCHIAVQYYEEIYCDE